MKTLTATPIADVARAARLSPFHFHRVFQVSVGETLAEFVKSALDCRGNASS